MEFEFSEEQKILQSTMAKFVEKEIAPLAAIVDEKEEFPWQSWAKLSEIGSTAMTLPSPYGDSFEHLSCCIVVEEIASACPATSLCLMVHLNLCADNIARNSNEFQKQKYLPNMASGKSIGAIAITEPDYGSDAMGMRTKAVRKGDHYFLNGTKTFISNGPVAGTFLVYAKTDMSKGPHGISAFIVEQNFPGFSVSKEFKKLGLHACPTAELTFEDCKVPAENILIGENKGLEIIMSGLEWERIIAAALSVGLGRGVLDLSVNYAKERVQFGKPISEFQLIQAKIADMYVDIEAARLLTYRAASLNDAGVSAPKEASAAKLFASDMAARAATEGVQIFGGYGYIKEFPIERYYRDAKIIQIGAGTSEIQKLLIAKNIFKG